MRNEARRNSLSDSGEARSVVVILDEPLESPLGPANTLMSSSSGERTTRDILVEREVGDSGLVGDEPLLLRENPLEDAEDAAHLGAIALDRARDFFRVYHNEPGDLSKVWALPACLEVKPLQLRVVFICAWRS